MDDRQTPVDNRSSTKPETRASDVSSSMFFLPESVAFILSNSIECNNGVTNINNNINIFNNSNLDLATIQQQAQNAKIIGNINTKNGKIQIKPNEQLSKIPLIKKNA